MTEPTFRKSETWTQVVRKLLCLLPSCSLPPDFGIVGAIKHVRQFLFDFAQTVGAQFECRLIEGIVAALFRETGVQVAQIGDFLAKAGEVFRNVGHHLHHTLYFSECPRIRLRLRIGRNRTLASGVRERSACVFPVIHDER